MLARLGDGVACEHSATSRKNSSTLLALAACVAICACNRSESREWQAIYAFGDSYSDSGAGYVDGNGPTAVAYLAESLQVPFTRAGTSAVGKSINFAVSGAQTGRSDGIRIRPGASACGANEALFNRGMQTQVADFVQRVRTGEVRFNPRLTLFFIAGGLNDGDLRTETTIANLRSEIDQLYAVGARLFLLALLPVKVPMFTVVSTRLNPAIKKIPEEVRVSLPGIHIELSRWGEYFDQVMNQHAKHGIVNITDRCAGRAVIGEDATPCATPDAFFYFHDSHPSTVVHRIVGAQLEREVEEAFP